MKILRAEKFKPKKRSESKNTKSETILRKTDWEILMKHGPSNDKLDMRSKEVIRDPASVKRLLEAEMIDPFGKLTSRAREKCKALAQKLDNSLLGLCANPPRHDESAAPIPATQKIGKMTPSVWAVLMKYDRQTGNLLRVDPETGLLDDSSRAILKKPSLIKLLIDKKLIQSGGWLTPKAKEGCARIEKKLIVKPACGTPVLQSKRRSDLKIQPAIGGHPDDRHGADRGVGLDSQNHHLSRDPVSSGETRSQDNQKAGIYSPYDRQDVQDLQAFFENLPDDASDARLNPKIYFEFERQEKGDLQAYFERLPGDDPDLIL